MNIEIDSRTELISKYYKYFIIGLFVRLFFASWTGHYYDLPIWLDSGEKIANGLSPYSSYVHLGQTILWALWTGFSYSISDLFFNLNLNVYIFFIKLFPIVIDMIIPIEIILMINSVSESKLSLSKEKMAIFSIWLNPYFIIISAFWAMIDNLAFFLIVISIFFIINGRYILPIVLTTISISVKLYPVIFLPLLALMVYWKQRNFLKAFLFGLSVIFLFLFVAYFPFTLFNWNNRQISGVLYSQLSRALGGVTPFGIITNLTVGNEFSDEFAKLHTNINDIFYLNFLWIIANIVYSIYLFVKYSKKLININISDEEEKRLLLKIGISLAINYFILWYFTAKYISEQNLITLVGFILLKFLIIDNSNDSTKVLQIFKFLNTTILIYLIFNTPIFVFFYLIVDIRSLINHLLIYQFLRSIFLVVSTLGLIVIILFSLIENIKQQK